MKSHANTGRGVAALAVLVSASGLALAVVPRPASADVTKVGGSAYGYRLNVSLFGGPVATQGPAPSVTLPPGGSAAPVTASAPTGYAASGPATFFSSGPLDVVTQGTTGPTGSVASATNIANVNASGQESFTASTVTSTCAASETGARGTTTIAGGSLQTDTGDDDPTNDIVDHPPVTVLVPVNPAPNTTFEGHIHIGNVTDSFRYVFNEQVVNPDGSLTVSAAHESLLGPLAVGDLFIGRSECGVTAAPATTTTTTTVPTTTTTVPHCGPVPGRCPPGLPGLVQRLVAVALRLLHLFRV